MTRTQTLPQTLAGANGHGARTAPHPSLPRRERRAVSYCDIWDLVAVGEPCPACEDRFEDRLARARSMGRRPSAP